jgi:5-methylcytosine-specific restriction endonuclease McrA
MSILSPKKKCTKCKGWKDKSEFNKNKSKWDGLASECRECANAQKRKWADDNPEKNRTYKREYEQKYPEKKKLWGITYYKKWRPLKAEQQRKRLRKFMKDNSGKALQWLRNWRKNNPEKFREQGQKWRKANPDKVKANWINRDARIRNAGGKITAQEWKALKEFYNYTCLCCGHKEPEIKLELDHVKSIKEGGRNVISNAQCLCRSCNATKSTKHIDYRPIIFYG